MKPTKKKYAIAIASIAAALVLSGCSGAATSDGQAAGGESGGAEGNDAVAAAQARVAEFTAEQPPIEIAPLPGEVEAGLTYGFITCPLPVCRTLTDASVEAAEAIGWETRQVETQMTPEDYVASWDQLLQDPPDVIAYIPFAPDSLIETQLIKASELGIPVVSIAPAGDRPDKEGPVFASYNGYPEFFQSASLMADLIVADGGTGADTVFVWDPALAAIWQPIKDGFDEHIQAAGPAAKVLEVSSQGIGTAVPGQIVSYLQANPDVKYVALALADLSIGVPEALQQAGLLENVKITSRAPQAGNLANVQAGLEWTTVGEEMGSNGWRVIDGLARLTLGETPNDEWFEPAGWAQIFTKDNVTQTSEPPSTPGSPEAFLAAWGVE